MEVSYVVAALAGVSLVAVVIWWYALLKRRKPRRLAYTTEEKALHQLAPLCDSLRTMPSGQYGKSIRRYQKRLRVALAVYAFERYGITVCDTVHASSIEQAAKEAGGGHDSLLRLKGLFDQANRLSASDHGPSEMLAVYEQAVGFLSGGSAPERHKCTTVVTDGL